MRWLTACSAVAWLCFALPSAASAQPPPCERTDGRALRDAHWRHEQPAHPLIGQVFKGDQPIAIARDGCTRSPLHELIINTGDIIRSGGVVLLGEVHDNPEHHAVRADILWPRLDRLVSTANLRPAAVFEHIRTSQQPQLDTFYYNARRSRRLRRAPDLLKELGWKDTGWPAAEIFYPLFDRVLWARMPIYPGNAVRERMRVLARGDRSNATQEEQVRLDMAETMPAPLLEGLTAELGGSHCGMVPSSAFGAMSLAQRYTDAHLADAVIKAAGKHGGAFLLAGNGHVRTDRGVPWYVRKLAPDRKMVAVMLLEVEDDKSEAAAYFPRAPDGSVAADYVVFTPRHDRPDPCEKMRQGKP